MKRNKRIRTPIEFQIDVRFVKEDPYGRGFYHSHGKLNRVPWVATIDRGELSWRVFFMSDDTKHLLNFGGKEEVVNYLNKHYKGSRMYGVDNEII